jgi:hypothetical protein
MIKFRYAMHKETKNVITYENWLELYSNKQSIYLYKVLPINNIDKYFDSEKDSLYNIDKNRYNSIEIIMSDDFEVIYDNLFTKEELGATMNYLSNCSVYDDRVYLLREKIAKEYRNEEYNDFIFRNN